MSNIINFNYNNHPMRSVNYNGEMWWVLKDVCDILGISHIKDTVKRLDIDEVGQTEVTDSLGRMQKSYIVSESGLYNVILRSDKPEAKPFRKWVTSEVLPTIRKTGGYVANEDRFINTYLSYADENTKNLFRLQLNIINQLNHKIETDKPLVTFAEQISDTTDLIDIGAYAKLLKKKGVKIGRNILFEWLRNNGYLRSNNEPYQQYINQGYFKTREYTYIVKGEPKIGIKTYVTGKGQHYLHNKLSTIGI